MRAWRILTVLVWPVGLALVAGLLAGVYAIRESVVARRAAEAKDDAPAPKRAANAVIKLGAEFAESQGIKDEPAGAVIWERRAPAFGRIVPNPRCTAEIRAAFAGTLRAAPTGWPALGGRVRAGEVLGWVDVRFGPQERLDLLSKLTDARAKAKGIEDLVRLHQERLDRLQAAGGGVSQSELDAARTHLAEARTQLAAAKAVEKEWQEDRPRRGFPSCTRPARTPARSPHRWTACGGRTVRGGPVAARARRRAEPGGPTAGHPHATRAPDRDRPTG
jgi:hypothetical protein